MPSELYGKFTWKIENFSEINKRELRSAIFEVGSYKWCAAALHSYQQAISLFTCSRPCVLMLCCCAGTSWSIRRAVMCATICHSSSVWQTMTSFCQVGTAAFAHLHRLIVETCIHRLSAQGD